MKLVVLGLSLSSSWGNGHATTYRALLKALRRARPRHAVPGTRRALVRATTATSPTRSICRLEFYAISRSSIAGDERDRAAPTR